MWFIEYRLTVNHLRDTFDLKSASSEDNNTLRNRLPLYIRVCCFGPNMEHVFGFVSCFHIFINRNSLCFSDRTDIKLYGEI